MTCVNKNSLNPYDWNWNLESVSKLIGTRKSDGQTVVLTKVRGIGSSGAYGTVYIYSGRLDGKDVKVAVKTFFSKNDDEILVLKYIKDKDLNLCKTCPTVVCLNDFSNYAQRKTYVAMETLQNELNFKHILINQDEKSAKTTNIDKSNKNTKDLFKYLSNIIDGVLCLANQKIYYFDFNPRNVMIKDCEDGKTEAILVDMGASVTFQEEKPSVEEQPSSYPPMYLNDNGEFNYYNTEDWYGIIEPTKVKSLKALLIFLSTILYLSLNINFNGEFVGKSNRDKDLNKYMFDYTPFRFKSFNSENAKKMFEQLKNYFSEDIYKNLISGLKAHTEEETKKYIKNLQKCFENKEVEEQRKAEEKIQKELEEQRKAEEKKQKELEKQKLKQEELEKQKRSSDIISRAFKRKQAKKELAKLKEKRKQEQAITQFKKSQALKKLKAFKEGIEAQKLENKQEKEQEKEFLKLAKEKAHELRSKILGKKVLEAARKNVELRKLQREQESKILKKQERKVEDEIKSKEKQSRKLAKKEKKEMRRQRRMESKIHSAKHSDKHSAKHSDKHVGHKEVKRRPLRKKECNEDQVRNPKTGRCVKKSGRIGKSLLKISDISTKNTRKSHSSKDGSPYKPQLKPKVKSRSVKKACNEDQIRNPKTGRCVKKSGRIGRKLI
jgi:hypothetical protein